MQFPLKFGNEIRMVRKISNDEFSITHREAISEVKYSDGKLSFSCSGWLSALLGTGEEKAVFVVCDSQNRVFALEIIDEKTYLNGRFVGGCYYFQTVASHMKNVKYSSKALIGLTFTGLVKAREYVYGYEWVRFQYSPNRKSAVDIVLTFWLRTFLASKFNNYKSFFRDVHDRNIMFEIRAKSESGVPAVIKDWLGKTQFVKVGIQPIDVR